MSDAMTPREVRAMTRRITSAATLLKCRNGLPDPVSMFPLQLFIIDFTSKMIFRLSSESSSRFSVQGEESQSEAYSKRTKSKLLVSKLAPFPPNPYRRKHQGSSDGECNGDSPEQ